jgi:hypothetical protein
MEPSMMLNTGIEVNQEPLVRPVPRSPAKDYHAMKATTYWEIMHGMENQISNQSSDD